MFVGSNTALSSQLMQVMTEGGPEGSFAGRPLHDEEEEELSLAEGSDDPKVPWADT